MTQLYQILNVLVWTLCATILVGMVGVFFGKVDPQFIEGLVSGALVTLITMMIKDLTNQPVPNTITTSTTVQPIEAATTVITPTETPKTGV